MFNAIKKYRENEKKVQLIKELNETIRECSKQLEDCAKELSEDLTESKVLFKVLEALSWLRLCEESDFTLNYHTIEDILYRKKKAINLCEEGKESITSYWERAKGNKDKLNELFEKGVPLFITLTSLTSGHKRYAMCYEFKRYESGKYYKGVHYQAYWFTGADKEGVSDFFNYLDYEVNPMTEEEFEQYYIMQRMNLMKFTDEKDAIEYDNYLRRLFHGQREFD